MTGLRTAVSFLTRIPAGGTSDPTRAVPWFPVVGAGVGAVSGLVYWAAGAATIPVVAAAFAVGVAVAITGAFHEDGLADTFDGLSSIRSVERQIEIMRDSRLGTFGVAALSLALVSRTGAVAALEVTLAAVVVLAWVHGLAAAVVIGVMVVSRPAAVDGSGADYLSRLPVADPIGVASLVVATGWIVVGPSFWAPTLAAVVGPVLVTLWAYRRIGGVTGDVLGACQQLALVGGLAIVAV